MFESKANNFHITSKKERERVKETRKSLGKVSCFHHAGVFIFPLFDDDDDIRKDILGF